MKKQIEKIEKAIITMDINNNYNYNNIEYLTTWYKKDLLFTLQKEWIDIQKINNPLFKKIIYSILWAHLIKDVMPIEIDIKNETNIFFQYIFLNNIEKWNMNKIVYFIKNLMKEYKIFLIRSLKDYYQKKNILIDNNLSYWIALYLMKKDVKDLILSEIVYLIIETLWSKWKNYQKIFFFLTTYFSWKVIIFWTKRYQLHYIDLRQKNIIKIIEELKELKTISFNINKLNNIIKQKEILKIDLVEQTYSIENEITKLKDKIINLEKRIKIINNDIDLINKDVNKNKNIFIWKNIKYKKNDIVKELISTKNLLQKDLIKYKKEKIKKKIFLETIKLQIKDVSIQIILFNDRLEETKKKHLKILSEKLNIFLSIFKCLKYPLKK